MSRPGTVTKQDVAIALVFTAKTTEEYERAHVAMRAAYPGLAASYPCDCRSCEDARARR